MIITTAVFADADNDTILVNDKMSVPAILENRHYQMILEWVDDGNTISPYVAPPPSTDEQRIDSAFPQSDTARVIFEALFELVNRVAVLESSPAITRAQLKTWLKDKLP